MNNMVLRRLGPASPGRQFKRDAKPSNEVVDTNPIVLWGRDKPAAILYLRQEEGAIILKQTIAKMTGPGLDAGFLRDMFHAYPIRYQKIMLTEMVNPTVPNSFLTDCLATADVDGDGVDEFILPRVRGGFEVYSTKKLLRRRSGEGRLPRGYYYVPNQSITVHLKNRDVVFYTSKLDNPVKERGKEVEPGAETPPYAVYRIDDKGIARVSLRGEAVPPEEISAFGALNRPGSNDIDELLVVASSGFSQREDLLFRYRPDGTAIGTAKEFPVPIHTGLEFLSAPESSCAILRDDVKVHFITPEKPADWIKTVDFEQFGGKNADIDVMHVVDAKSDPKVVVSIRERLPNGHVQTTADLFAVNAEGRCFAPEPGGRGWRPLPGRKPYRRIEPPSPLHDWVDILPASDGSDDLLIVHRRKAQIKELPDEKILPIGQKFLTPKTLQDLRDQRNVHLPGDMWVVKGAVEYERQTTGITQEIKTVDDWRRLLPKSYEKAREICESQSFTSLVKDKLLDPLAYEKPVTSDIYRNLDDYRAWLAGQAIGPETRFTFLRGDVETSWDVEASVSFNRNSVVPGDPVLFRSTKNGVTIVFSSDASKFPDPCDSYPEKHLPGFYVLRPSP